jgi:hypothetical protein
MCNQNELRKRVKLLKAYGGVSSYKELAEEYLETSYKGFLNWLNGQYEYGHEKVELLDSIIDDLLPPM